MKVRDFAELWVEEKMRNHKWSVTNGKVWGGRIKRYGEIEKEGGHFDGRESIEILAIRQG